jgi:dTMP kinase
VFVTFEGPEGAGKTTVITAVSEALQARGASTFLTREPGGGSLGIRIRELLLGGDHVDPRAELLLFLADRAQHVSEMIRPALNLGKVVLCDRFTDSTIAYQGYARGFDLSLLREWNDFATGGLKPTLTILLDVAPEIGLARVTDKDRMDREPLQFHQNVRQGFLSEAAREPHRWIVIDASMPLADVTASAVHAVVQRQTQL